MHSPEPWEAVEVGADEWFIVKMEANGDGWEHYICQDGSKEDSQRIVAAVNFCQHIPTELLERLVEARVGAATLVQWIRRCSTYDFQDSCDGEVYDEGTVCVECNHRVERTGIHADDCLLKAALDLIGEKI